MRKGHKIFILKKFIILLDVSSWENLDLIHMNKKAIKGEYNSLFTILDNCATPGGRRTLRSCVLQPCANTQIINKRLDVVAELVNNTSVSLFIKNF